MKWKQRKRKSRIHAQQRKKNRGRNSGASNKTNYHQSKLMEVGYNNIHHLLYNLIRKP